MRNYIAQNCLVGHSRGSSKEKKILEREERGERSEQIQVVLSRDWDVTWTRLASVLDPESSFTVTSPGSTSPPLPTGLSLLLLPALVLYPEPPVGKDTLQRYLGQLVGPGAHPCNWEASESALAPAQAPPHLLLGSEAAGRMWRWCAWGCTQILLNWDGH